MSHLFLVRHGQASFLQPDSDRLSTKGEEQSRLLGGYWSKHRVAFDAVYSGPRSRQKDTARIVGEEYRRAGGAWPEPEILNHFDEFRAEAAIPYALPKLVPTDEHVRAPHQAFQNAAPNTHPFTSLHPAF